MPAKVRYRRVLLKISGESLCTPGAADVDLTCLSAVAKEIAAVAKMGVRIGLVVGAGNIVRGRHFASGISAGLLHRTTADYMGMLGTVINALALRDVLDSCGTPAHVMSAIPMGGLCETFSRRAAVEHMDAGSVVIFAGGTGSPFFTTDMCAALRAGEMDADVLLKATKVDGVYDSDPVKNRRARKHNRLTYQKFVEDRLGVMDLAAVAMCMESRIPIVVFQLSKPGNLRRAIRGEKVGTIIAD
jgi:uridylate kinase